MGILTSLAMNGIDALLKSSSKKEQHPAVPVFNAQWQSQMAKTAKQTKGLLVAEQLQRKSERAQQIGKQESRNVAQFTPQQKSMTGLKIIRSVSQRALSDKFFNRLIEAQGARQNVPPSVGTMLAIATNSSVTEGDAETRQPRTKGFITQPTLDA